MVDGHFLTQSISGCTRPFQECLVITEWLTDFFHDWNPLHLPWARDRLDYMFGFLSSNFYAKIFTSKTKIPFGKSLSHEVWFFMSWAKILINETSDIFLIPSTPGGHSDKLAGSEWGNGPRQNTIFLWLFDLGPSASGTSRYTFLLLLSVGHTECYYESWNKLTHCHASWAPTLASCLLTEAD